MATLKQQLQEAREAYSRESERVNKEFAQALAIASAPNEKLEAKLAEAKAIIKTQEAIIDKLITKIVDVASSKNFDD
jgi:glutaredoxin 2